MKNSSETNQDKRLLHNRTSSECESYKTTADGKNKNKIPSGEYRYTTIIILLPNNKEKKKSGFAHTRV